MTARVSMLLKSRPSPETSLQPLYQEKTCNSAYEQTPLSNDTIVSVLRHREVGRTKDLSTPLRISYYAYVPRLKMVFITETCFWLLMDEVVFGLDLYLFYLPGKHNGVTLPTSILASLIEENLFFKYNRSPLIRICRRSG
jgi:hypothetical protein